MATKKEKFVADNFIASWIAKDRISIEQKHDDGMFNEILLTKKEAKHLKEIIEEGL